MDLAKLKDERKAALATVKPASREPDPDGGGPEPTDAELFPPAHNPGAMR